MTPRNTSRLDARYLRLAGIVLAISLAVYLLLGRPLVEAIYYGRIPALAGLLQGQTTQGLGFYLSVFGKLALMAFAVEALTLLLIGVAGGWVRFGSESAEWLAIAGIIAGIVFVLSMYGAIREPISYTGDASEYYQITQSFINHGTPDLRQADTAKYDTERLSHNVIGGPPLNGYLESPVDGRWYSVHFWAYSLFSVPVRLLLLLFGLPGMKALELLNILVFFGSITAMLLLAEMAPMKRAVFSSILVLSPVVWYVPWSSPEVFSAAFVVFSIVFFTRKRYALAALFVSVAATQNLPLILLTSAYVIYASVRWLPEKRYGSVALVALAGCVALAPMAFYYSTFRLLSPLSAGFAGWGNVSLARFVGFFFDLDMGMFPYLPLVTVTFVIASVVAVVRLDWWTIARVLVIVGMVILAATTARGWNSAVVGLMRYAIWALPVMLWVVVDSLGTARRSAFVSAALISVQLAALFLSLSVSQPYQNQHGLLGRLALATAPWLYSPPAEEFAARSTGMGVSASEFQPIAFERSGQVTKVLADRARLAKLADYYEISPSVVASLRPWESDATGFYYVNLKPGEAKLRTQDTTIAALPYPITAQVGGPSALGPSDEKTAADRFNIYPLSPETGPTVSPLAMYPLYVTVQNSSTATWFPAGSRPLGIVVDTMDEAGRPTPGLKPLYYPLIQAVFPGQKALMYPSFETPAKEGAYRLVVSFFQKDENDNQVPIPGVKTEVPIAVRIAPPMSR